MRETGFGGPKESEALEEEEESGDWYLHTGTCKLHMQIIIVRISAAEFKKHEIWLKRK